MMRDIRIKASPGALQQSAQEVEKAVAELRIRFQGVEEAVNRSEGYWQGDAADTHRSIYREMKTDAEEILARFQEHAGDLRAMAANYLEAEQEVKGHAADLPSDVIL